jgi:hypothetical protein
MASMSQWAPYQKFVQAGMKDGQFLNAGFTVLAAGPPRLSALGGQSTFASALAGSAADQIVMPLGLIQNVNLSHNRTFNRIFEIGSERSYFISGRTMGQLSIARILYHGPSLLRLIYAYYSDAMVNQQPPLIPSVFPNAGVATMANPHDVVIPPGYENFYINLASDLFNQPIGLLMYNRDSNMETYGAVYLEGCYVPNHTWATDSQGVIIQESAAIQFERAVPVAVSGLTLLEAASADAAELGVGSL